MAAFVTYVPYSALNDGKPSTLEEFQTNVAGFSRTRLLHLCSVLNALLRSEEDSINVEAHDALVRAFFEPNTANQLLRKEGDVRFVIHRQQILFLAKTAVLVCSEDGAVPDAKHFAELGRILLMAGDHLPAREPGQLPADLEEKFACIAALLLPTQEASGVRFDHKMARSWAMLTKSMPKTKGSSAPFWDVPEQFERATQIPLDSFQSLLFGSLAKFREFDPAKYLEDPRNYGLSLKWFASTKVPQATVAQFLDQVSATPDQYREFYEKKKDWGNNDFTALRDRPLFRDGEFLFPIDFAFLAEKFETAPFWVVHDSLEKEKQKDFHAFWGKVFEQYGCDLVVEASTTRSNVIYPRPQFKDKQKGQVCDVIVVCGSAAVFIELKGATFTSKAKYSSDYEALRTELEKKLVREDDGEAKAVYQLKRAVELACSESPEAIDGLDVAKMSRIYPMVVTRDDIGGVFGVNAYLQVRFDSAFNRKALKKTVTPLHCMNAEDFERLTAYFDDVALTDLLDAHYRATKKHGSYFVAPYFTLKENEILKEKGMRQPNVPRRNWKELTEMAVSHLGLQAP